MMKTLTQLAAASTLLVWGAAACAGNLVVSVLDRDGKPVQDAVVVVVPANKSALPKTPMATQATVNQEKMQFIPAVTVVPVGAKVSFVNNDPWDHHVRSSPAGMGQFSATNAGFELRLEGKSDGKPAKSTEVTLDKAGVVGATLLGCFIHGSMRGYIYASESPWAAKTSADGIATFEDLPEGTAQLKVWHADQLVDIAPQQVTVGAVLAKNVMQLTVVPRRRRS
ncbi:plastocyanin [Polaromonas sp. SP1]|jgi:plastocyanin|nr:MULTISPECIES: plastocyanin [unclassified Polaromonas]AYQ28650.1 plastocyanin [Polaromonas sp. SP1]QGJ20233.1 plastocyanin [Polaromonas sp. Pch-P]